MGQRFSPPFTNSELTNLRDSVVPSLTNELELQVLVDQLEVGGGLATFTQPGTDFRVYRGTSIIPGSSDSVTIKQGTDFTVPSWVKKEQVFCRITNTRLCGAGDSATPNILIDLHDFTVHCEITGSEWCLDTTAGIKFKRQASPSDDCRVDWEVIAYTGELGGANEITVRGVEHVSGTGSFGQIIASTFSVGTFADCVPVMSGQSSDGDTWEWSMGLFHSGMNDLGGGNARADFLRGTTSTDSGTVSYFLIEFTGSNWSVRRQYVTSVGTVWTGFGDSSSWTYALDVAVADVTKAFLFPDYSTTNWATGLDDAGDAYYIDSTTALRIWNRANAGARRKVAWIVENSQDVGGRAMSVSRALYADDTSGPGTHVRTFNVAIPAVFKTSETSVIATCSLNGTGNATPRGALGYTLSSETTITFFENDDVNYRRIAYQVIEWPRSQYTGFEAVRHNVADTRQAIIDAIDALLP